MNRYLTPSQTRSPKVAKATFAALAGFATAALVGVALAATFTLQVAKNAKVTNQARTTVSENIVVTSRGFAVYSLSGDSMRHPECTMAKGCFKFWPPVTVSSPKKLSKAHGVSGKLGVWHRDGFFQVMLGGHPLYRFRTDSQRDHATGEGINTFGGTWHVVKAASSGGGTTMSTGTTTTMTTTTSTTCLYPPCY